MGSNPRCPQLPVILTPTLVVALCHHPRSAAWRSVKWAGISEDFHRPVITRAGSAFLDQVLGAVAIRHRVCTSHSLWETAPCVQQTLDAVVERLLLLNRVVEHLCKAGEGAKGRVFKNARFLNTFMTIRLCDSSPDGRMVPNVTVT